MKNLSSNIDVFVNLYQARVESISTIKSSNPDVFVFDDIFKKVLYVTLLDSLSKTVFPNRNNRDRIVSLLQSFCDWKEADKISLPHLLRLLEKAPDPAFEELRTFAFSQIDLWERGKIISLEQDPTAESVKTHWPVEKEHRLPIEGVSMDSLKHAHLFYTYRNSLVHEFRHPGIPFEIRKDGLPYYIGRLPDSTEHPELESMMFSEWELNYPLGFFKDLCLNALRTLGDYYTRNRIDPMSFFDYGSYWLTELN